MNQSKREVLEQLNLDSQSLGIRYRDRNITLENVIDLENKMIDQALSKLRISEEDIDKVIERTHFNLGDKVIKFLAKAIAKKLNEGE